MTSDHRDRAQDRYLFIGLLAIIALLPLPHGGELVWEHAPFICGIFLLFTLWLLQQWQHSRPLPAIVQDIKLPLILLGIWLGYIFLQTLPLSDSVMGLLSPARADINQHARLAGANPTSSLSIDPASTLHELLRYASYITLFCLVLVLCNTPARLKQLAVTLFVVGFAQALYSLVNYYTHGALSINDPIPPWGTPWDKATRGTYSHRNHFAALMELLIPVGIGLLIPYFKPNPNRDWNSRLKQLLSFLMSIEMIYSFGVALMLAALAFSASRGGNGAFVSALFISSVVFVLLQGKKARTLKLIPIVAVILIVVFGLLGANNLANRFEKQGIGPNGRDYMRSASYLLIADYPIIGSGAGTYPHIFYHYKMPELGVTTMSKRAHNDYLELLADEGIIGFGLLGSSVILLFVPLVRGIKNRRNPQMIGMLFAALFGTLAMLIHSFVEFNFHIAANASYFFVLLAMGLVAANRNIRNV